MLLHTHQLSKGNTLSGAACPSQKFSSLNIDVEVEHDTFGTAICSIVEPYLH